MRDRLLQQVNDRLQRFGTDKDPAVVLDPDALAELNALLDTAPDLTTDLPIAYAAGWLHWFRYLVLATGEEQPDLEAALALFAAVYQADPEAVPPELHAFFGQNGPDAFDFVRAEAPRAVLLLQHAMRTDTSVLTSAIDLLRRAVTATPTDHPDRGVYLSNLGTALQARYEHSRELEDLSAAISHHQDAEADTPTDHPNRAVILYNLRVSLNSAIDAMRDKLATIPSGHPDRIPYLAELGNSMVIRFRYTYTLNDLGSAIEYFQAAATAAPVEYSDRARYLSDLSHSLRARYERTGVLDDLNAAIDAMQDALTAHPDRETVQASIGALLASRYERTGVLDDLNAAIDAMQDALTAHPDRALYLSNLGSALARRFERTGALDDLNAAIDHHQNAVTTTLADDPYRVMYLSNLGSALESRFERIGMIGDLNAAIDYHQNAVAMTPDSDRDRAEGLSRLGSSLARRFERTGALEDLNAAIDAVQDAVTSTPTGRPHRAAYLSNLGILLHFRFERTGALDDLNAAIDHHQNAATTTPTGHRHRATTLSNLGTALQVRFERTGALDDLNAAIDHHQNAATTTPTGHPDRAMYLSNLGIVLALRFQRTGALDDLNAAIDHHQNAATTTPAGHLHRAARQGNLGLALSIRFERTGALEDLNTAINAAQDALTTTPPEHPGRASALANLAGVLSARFDHTGSESDLNAAIEAARAATEVTGASPRMRAMAAIGWGRLTAGAELWAEAVKGFTAAIELVGQLAPRSLQRSDQERLLADLGSLGADAAVCCVHAGQPARAVELFESGRGVLLGQLLDARTDLTTLNDKHPGLAAAFTRLRNELDHTERSPFAPAGSATPSAGHDAQQRQRAGTELETLIDQIRTQPGFDGFLRPPSISDLYAAADNGPVVIVAVSTYGSHALILTSHQVDTVPLPDLTPQAVYDQVLAFLTALDTRQEDRLGEVLGWLWDSLAAPVLDQLGITGPPGQPWPQIWWCNSGLLGFLPVHAAGHHSTRHDPSPQTLLDRVVSSHTPTLRGLLHARRPTLTGQAGQVLAVGMPHTPGAGDLPGAAAETTALARRFPDHARPLIGPDATRQAVATALPTARWAHFACHGTAEIIDPWESRLLLHDGSLTVTDITRLQLDRAELAFLSACETARPGARLADEAIHLASAFQLAGFRHVIATLWPINDDYAVRLAEHIYTALIHRENLAATVHQAVKDLRDYQPRNPSLWASHLHTGA